MLTVSPKWHMWNGMFHFCLVWPCYRKAQSYIPVFGLMQTDILSNSKPVSTAGFRGMVLLHVLWCFFDGTYVFLSGCVCSTLKTGEKSGQVEKLKKNARQRQSDFKVSFLLRWPYIVHFLSLRWLSSLTVVWSCCVIIQHLVYTHTGMHAC